MGYVRDQIKRGRKTKAQKRRDIREKLLSLGEDEDDFLEPLEAGEYDDIDDDWAFLDPKPENAVPPEKENEWRSHPGSQDLFLRCPVFEVLIEGTRGGGKTDALIVDFLQHVGSGWGADWRGILFRETYPQLDDVKKKCRKLIPRIFPSATFNKNDHTWTFPDGEQLLLRHMKTTDDYNNYHGHEYPWIGWEELTNWATDECYRLMMSCCRSSVPKTKLDKSGRPMPRKYRATTNPYGKGHNWVKRRFQLPQMRGKILYVEDDFEGGGKKEIRPRIAIHSRFDENKKLAEAEPDYFINIRGAARNKAEEAAWLYGDWDITSGGMFDDIWDSTTHIIEPFDIPKTWRIDRSFDWGSTKPASVGWWAESDGSDVKLKNGKTMSTVRGDLYRVMEWYVAKRGVANKGLQLTAHDIAAGIVLREMAKGWRFKNMQKKNRVRPGPADSSIWDDSGGPSIASQMMLKVRVDGKLLPGIVWEKADKSPGSRKNGWEEIRQRLKNVFPPEGGVREKPGLFVFNTCVDFINTFPSLPRDEKDPDDVDTDSEDHIADETRYRVKTPRRVIKYGKTRGGA